MRRTGPLPLNLAAQQAAVDGMEASLAALGLALHQQDSAAIAACADDLQQALAQTLQSLRDPAQNTAAVPDALRRRLAGANAAITAQRERLARASAALDRALETLMPEATETPAVYAPNGVGPAAQLRKHYSA